MNIYDRYFKWNDALWEYYTQNDNDTILLYVDEDIINEIGEENKLGDVESFIDSILLTYDERKKFKDEYKLANGPDVSSKGFVYKTYYNFVSTLLEKQSDPTNPIFSNFESDQKCPCFSILLLAVYGYGLCNKWEGFENIMRRKFGTAYKNEWNQVGGRELIDCVLSNISNNFDERILDDMLATNERFAGKIKYHLVLKPREKREIYNIMFHHYLSFTESDDFDRFITELLTYVNDKELIDKIRDINNKEYLITFFNNFDRDSFCEVKDRVTTESFSIKALYYFCKGMLGLGVRNIDKDIVGDNFTISHDEDSRCFGLYPMQVEGLGVMQKRTFKNNKLNISTNDFFIIERLGRRKWREVLMSELVEGNQYIFCFPERYNDKKIKGVLAGQKCSEVTDNISGAKGLKKFCVDSWRKVLSIGCSRSSKQAVIEFGLGIKTGRKDYFTFGLPYIQINDTNRVCDVRITYNKIDFDVDEFREVEDYREVDFDNDTRKIFYNITDVDQRTKVVIDVRYKYVDESGIREEVLCKEITLANCENVVRKSDIRTNSWGIPVETNDGGAYYQNNVVCCKGRCLSGGHEEGYSPLGQFDYVQSVDYDKFRLIHLLCCLNNERALKKEDFKNVMSYVLAMDYNSGRMVKNISYSIEGALINTLETLGYLDKNDIGDNTEYKLNSLKIVKTNLHDNNSKPLYRLYGAYSIDDLSMLDEWCEKPVLARLDEDSEWGYVMSKCLPPTVIVPESAIDDIMEVFDDVEIMDKPLAYDTIEFARGVEDFENIFLNKYTIPEGETEKYFSNPVLKNGFLYMGNYIYKKYYRRYNGKVYRIPGDMLKLYCTDKNDRPFMIKGNNRLYFTDDMGLPKMIRRSLVELNLSLPARKKAFCVDNVLYEDEPWRLFIPISCYDTSDDISNIILNKISGRCDAKKLVCREYIRSGHLKIYIYLDKSDIGEYRLFLKDQCFNTILYSQRGQNGDEVWIQKFTGDDYHKVVGDSISSIVSSYLKGDCIDYYHGETITSCPEINEKNVKLLIIDKE